MNKKTIFELIIPSLDYDSIARISDREVSEHFAYFCGLSKRRIVPAKVRFNRYHVSRGTNHVTLHLWLDADETCRVQFVPFSFSTPT